MTGACCGFSVTPSGENQAIFLQALKQISWNAEARTGTFDSSRDGKINLKFSLGEVGAMMNICRKQRGKVSFFHKSGATTSQINFGVYPNEDEPRGVALSINKGDKKISIPFSFDECVI